MPVSGRSDIQEPLNTISAWLIASPLHGVATSALLILCTFAFSETEYSVRTGHVDNELLKSQLYLAVGVMSNPNIWHISNAQAYGEAQPGTPETPQPSPQQLTTFASSPPSHRRRLTVQSRLLLTYLGIYIKQTTLYTQLFAIISHQSTSWSSKS
jgi:hypothetical protein